MDFLNKDKFNPKDSGLAFSLVTVALIIMSFGIGLAYMLFPSLKGYMDYLSVALTQGAIFFTAYIYCKINKIPFLKALGLKKPLKAKPAAFSVLTGFTMILTLIIPAALFIKLLELLGYNSSASSGFAINSVPDLALGTLFIAVLPAICEEILFRGVILQGLRRFGDFFAVIISSLLFMLMHQNPSQTLFPFLSGLVLGLVFVKTGGVKYCMIIHFLNNFISLIWEFVYNALGIEESSSFLGMYSEELILISLGVLGFTLAMSYFLKVKGEPYHNPQPKIIRPNPYFYPYFNYGYNPYFSQFTPFGFEPYGNNPNMRNTNNTDNSYVPTNGETENINIFEKLYAEGYIYNPKNGAYYLPEAADKTTEIPPYFDELTTKPNINPFFTSKRMFLIFSLGGIIVSAAIWLVSFFGGI